MQAVPLAEIMVEALKCRHAGAAESAIDYFESLNQTPVASRHQLLGQPLFEVILPCLVDLARFPEEFVSWDDCVDTDKDTFSDFRSGPQRP